VVSRDFVAGNDDIVTVVCAPVYSEALGLRTEVAIGPEDGVPRESAVRFDFLSLMVKRKLTGFVGTLSAPRQAALKDALRHALQIDRPPGRGARRETPDAQRRHGAASAGSPFQRLRP
jgi:mRNA-degrading endonuclease toxin of MazEF toxin-antitoxin module